MKENIVDLANEINSLADNVQIHKARSITLAKRVVIVCEFAKDVVPVVPSMHKYLEMLYVCLEEIKQYFVSISGQSKSIRSVIQKDGQNEETFVKWNESLQHVIAELFIQDISIPQVFDPAVDESDFNLDLTDLQKMLSFTALFAPESAVEPALKLVESQKSQHGQYKTKVAPNAQVEIDPKLVKIEKEIGRGGFGIVYKARYRGEQVAVKSIPANQVNEQSLKALEIEASLMRRLSHPRIVAGYGLYIHEQNYCVIMEYLPNGSLSTYLNTQPEIAWGKKIDFALDIAQGMAFLHKVSIVHRDLKPGNIVLDAHDRAKITDFGLSVIKSNSSTSIAMSEAGTAAYMAPENFGLSPTYSTKSDVYAFSMILWELSHWKTSYSGVIVSEIKDSIRNGDRLDIDNIIPARVKELIILCWAQNPRDRPPFVDIVPILTALSDEFDIKAPPSLKLLEKIRSAKDEGNHKPSTYAKRKRILWILVFLLIGLAIGTGITLAVVLQSKASNQNQFDTGPPPSSLEGTLSSTTTTTSSLFAAKSCLPSSSSNYSVTTFAGIKTSQGYLDGPRSTALFHTPSDIVMDQNFNSYIADSLNNVIRFINASTNIVSTLAGTNGTTGYTNGPIQNATFTKPTRLCLMPDGTLIIKDNGYIRKIDPARTTVSTVLIFSISSMLCDTDTIWIPDGYTNIYRITVDGNVISKYGSGLGFRDGPLDQALFRWPVSMVKDSLGNYYVADEDNFRIRIIYPNNTIDTIVGNGTFGTLNGPGRKALLGNVFALAIDSKDNLYFGEWTPSTNTIRKVDLNCPQYTVSLVAGSYYGNFDGIGTYAQFDGIEGISVNSKGEILLADAANQCIRKVVNT